MAKAEGQRLDRKNFIVDGSKVKRLKRVLRPSSGSEAIRMAVDRALNAEETITALGQKSSLVHFRRLPEVI